MNPLKNCNYFLDVAEAVSKKSTCSRLQVGCVITDLEGVILSTGYNQTPAGFKNCNNPDLSQCQDVIHAELNAVLCAARKGTPLKDCIIFVTHSPCKQCFNLLMQLKPKNIVFRHKYRKSLHLTGGSGNVWWGMDIIENYGIINFIRSNKK